VERVAGVLDERDLVRERNAVLSRPVTFSLPRKNSVSFPVFADGLDWVSS